MAVFINMFPFAGVRYSIKSPLAPLLKKGGNAYTPTMLIVAIGVLIRLRAFYSSPFDIIAKWHNYKRGTGGFYKKPIGPYFCRILQTQDLACFFGFTFCFDERVSLKKPQRREIGRALHYELLFANLLKRGWSI